MPGTVVIDKGVLRYVGAADGAPEIAGATVIDGTGKVVTPGFIDSNTNLGVVEAGGAPHPGLPSRIGRE